MEFILKIFTEGTGLLSCLHRRPCPDFALQKKRPLKPGFFFLNCIRWTSPPFANKWNDILSAFLDGCRRSKETTTFWNTPQAFCGLTLDSKGTVPFINLHENTQGHSNLSYKKRNLSVTFLLSVITTFSHEASETSLFPPTPPIGRIQLHYTSPEICTQTYNPR